LISTNDHGGNLTRPFTRHYSLLIPLLLHTRPAIPRHILPIHTFTPQIFRRPRLCLAIHQFRSTHNPPLYHILHLGQVNPRITMMSSNQLRIFLVILRLTTSQFLSLRIPTSGLWVPIRATNT
jgi:hypothetical protein